MRVLLTGARAPATLELARLCARAGHEVHAADTGWWHVCRGSRHVAAVHRLPPPRVSPDGYAAALRRLVTSHGIDVIVPTCEEIFHVAAIDTPLGADVICESRDRLAALHDKWRFIGLTRDAGLQPPQTVLLDAAARAAAVPLPAETIVKPRFSRFATRVLRLAPTAPLPVVVTASDADWVAQEFLPGEALCTWSVIAAGQVTAHVTYAVEASAGTYGAAICFRSVRHSGVRAWVERFAAFHRLSGQFAFDFIADAGGVRAIECNPRLTSGIHCFRALPGVAERLLSRTTTHAVLEPPEGLRFRSRLALRMYGHRSRPGAGLLDASDDPWPARLQLITWADLLVRAAAAGMDPRRYSTHDIEWNGE